MKLSDKELKILSIFIATMGIFLIGSGITMSQSKKTITKINYKLSVSTQKIPEVQAKTNEIILKDIEIEINNPISVNVEDYLVDVDKISSSMLKELSKGLDTSQVNITQAGTYKYTITYKKKKYQGTVKVKEKELPNVTFTLKEKRLPTTGTISTNVREYINENISDEIANNIILDLTEVRQHQNIPGKYSYKIIYKDTTYYGDFYILEPVTTGNNESTCPSDATKENNTCVCNDTSKTYDESSNTCK